MITLIDPDTGKTYQIENDSVVHNLVAASIVFSKFLKQAETGKQLGGEVFKDCFDKLIEHAERLNQDIPNAGLMLYSPLNKIQVGAIFDHIFPIYAKFLDLKRYAEAKTLAVQLLGFIKSFKQDKHFKANEKKVSNIFNAAEYDTYCFLGFAALGLQDYILAETCFKKSLALTDVIKKIQKDNNNIIYNTCRIGLAAAYFRQGWVEYSQLTLNKIEGLLLKDIVPYAVPYIFNTLISLYVNIANYYRIQDNYYEGLNWLKRSIELIEKVRTSLAKLALLMNISGNGLSTISKDLATQLAVINKLYADFMTKHVATLRSSVDDTAHKNAFEFNNNQVILSIEPDLATSLQGKQKRKQMPYVIHDNKFILDAARTSCSDLLAITKVMAKYEAHQQAAQGKDTTQPNSQTVEALIPQDLKQNELKQQEPPKNDTSLSETSYSMIADVLTVRKPKRSQLPPLEQPSSESALNVRVPVKHIWPNNLDANNPYLYDENNPSCPVKPMRDSYTPEGIWYGYIDKNAIEGTDITLQKQLLDTLSKGHIINGAGQGIKRIKPKWRSSYKQNLFKIKLKGQNGRGDTRLMGHLESTIKDERGRQCYLVKFDNLDTNYHKGLRRS
jgi:tetratricopeptide (TPR) repeat protein